MSSMASLDELNRIDGILGNSIRMTLATSHEERLAAVEYAIDFCGYQLTKNKHIYFNKSEDDISVTLVSMLVGMGLSATHDTQYGGHCDIVIESRDNFLWIAEAKLDKDLPWLEKGFQQLDTRYSTGLSGQDAGEMLIYCRKPNIVAIMSDWLAHMSTARPDVAFRDNDPPLLDVKRSSHTHKATGGSFRVRHKLISVYFEPQDRVSPVKKRGARKAKATAS